MHETYIAYMEFVPWSRGPSAKSVNNSNAIYILLSHVRSCLANFHATFLKCWGKCFTTYVKTKYLITSLLSYYNFEKCSQHPLR